MATQKPISTISYNSEAFLREKLEAWYEAHIIQAYMYICHKGEDGDKDHIHLRIEPNKRIDPMDLQNELREFTANNPKPLGCRPFRPSIEEDWLLYAVHDEKYLALKYPDDKSEKIPYKWEDIKASDGYDVEVAYIRAKSKQEHTSSNVASRIMNGEHPKDLILQGENPFIVTSVLRTMQTSDYSRLQNQLHEVSQHYEELHQRYRELIDAVQDFGLEIGYDDDNKIKIFKNPFNE